MHTDNRLIFDVGMHNGDDTAFYLHRGFRVVAIEADPALAEQGRRRFAREIEEGRLTLLNVGIAPQEGTATFWLCEGRSEWNSFDRACASRQGHACRPIEVPCRRFASILREHGAPHYIKIDIETHDRHCLADLRGEELPKYISIELTAMAELIKLQSLGYDAFKLVLQGHHAAVKDETLTLRAWVAKLVRAVPQLAWIARKLSSLAGKLSRASSRLFRGISGASQNNEREWVFPFGSSGPFGEEAPGEWIGFDEAAFRWLALQRIYPGEVWCDVHAVATRSAEQGVAASTLKAA